MQTRQIYHLHYNAKELKLPLNLGIKIPFDSEVRTFDEVFDKSGVKKHLVANKFGRDGYNLVSMLKLVLFCNMINIYSLRDMEKAAKNDIRIMWLTDEITPSHQAIGNFINKHLTTSLKNIFKELNEYIIKKDNVNTDIMYIDGTKIESVANKYTFIWRGSVEKFESKLHLKITKLIKKLNKEYNPSGISFNDYDIYELKYLENIKMFLEKQIRLSNPVFVYGSGRRKTSLQRFYEEISEYITKLKEYKNHLEIMGKTRNSYSKTDHDATFMRMKEDYM
jgi:transposase